MRLPKIPRTRAKTSRLNTAIESASSGGTGFPRLRYSAACSPALSAILNSRWRIGGDVSTVRITRLCITSSRRGTVSTTVGSTSVRFDAICPRLSANAIVPPAIATV